MVYSYNIILIYFFIVSLFFIRLFSHYFYIYIYIYILYCSDYCYLFNIFIYPYIFICQLCFYKLFVFIVLITSLIIKQTIPNAIEILSIKFLLI